MVGSVEWLGVIDSARNVAHHGAHRVEVCKLRFLHELGSHVERQAGSPARRAAGANCTFATW
ncbi:hypothetical protein EI541_00435 [Xanthomonas citri pv. eucalyptorum]|nr:hypothetical protein EI541_00435 [Xanthomonas axonopodis pv. eucalyptorum]